MKKNKYSKIFFFLLLLFFLLGVNPVRNIVSNGAGFVFALEINYPRIPGTTPPQDFDTRPTEERLPLYVLYIFNFVIWLGGAIAFFSLIYGGIRYLISTGKPEAIISAKDQIVSAFFGLLLLLSSFLILKILSPQFVVLKIPTLKPAEMPVKKEIPFPEKEIKTSIDTEMPFGRLIEGKIFETYISDWPEPKEKREPRMQRIRDLVTDTEMVAGEIRDEAKILEGQVADLEDYKADLRRYEEDLKKYEEGSPEAQEIQDNIARTERAIRQTGGEIDEIENEMKGHIGELKTLIQELCKEVKELKIELDRLERGAKYIEECPLRVLNTFSQFLQKKDFYERSSKDPKAQNVVLREIKFWDDISIAYKPYDYLKKEEKEKPDNDFATFKCAVSGTMEQEPPFSPKLKEYEDILTGEESEEEAERILNELAERESEEILTEEMACSDEAPVGEIIDRSLRTGELLVKKLEELIVKLKILKALLEGDIVGLVKEILNKAVDIISFITGTGKEPKTIGIITIIDEIVPEILKDLDWYVRMPMKECISESFETRDIVLFNCLQAKGATTPEEGRVIHLCCVTEQWKDGEKKQTVYGDCFEECFLEKGIDKHRECVQKCLDRKGQELKDEELPFCFHQLNFYCCSP